MNENKLVDPKVLKAIEALLINHGMWFLNLNKEITKPNESKFKCPQVKA